MWYILSRMQQSYELSDRLIRTINNWGMFPHDEDVSNLLAAGAEVNRIHGTLLPLHCAAMVGDSECVQLLINHGAQINALDGYHRAALHYAAERNEKCVATLIKNGAYVDIADSNHNTALHWAAFKNNVRAVEVLLHCSANVNIRDDNGNTPLSWAAHKGNLESVRVLLNFNASVNICNHSGYSPLGRCAGIMAIGLGSDEDEQCFELLIRASGQFDLRNAQGQLPAHLAVDNRLHETLMTLCQNTCGLKELCRYVIRQQLGATFLPRAVSSLPIPLLLQEYLLLKK